MTIGRSDDPENPLGVQAFEAAFMFGLGSRTPSGPAAVLPPQQRTDPSSQSIRPSEFSFLLLHPRGRPHMHQGGDNASLGSRPVSNKILMRRLTVRWNSYTRAPSC